MNPTTLKRMQDGSVRLYWPLTGGEIRGQLHRQHDGELYLATSAGRLYLNPPIDWDGHEVEVTVESGE